MSAFVINHVKICRISSFIILQNLVVVSCTVYVPVGGTKIVDAGAPPFGMGLADALRTHYPHICYHTKFCTLGKTVWAHVASHKNSWDAGALHPWDGGMDDLLESCYPPRIIIRNFVTLRRTD